MRFIVNFLMAIVTGAGMIIGWNIGSDMYTKEKQTGHYSQKIKNFVTRTNEKEEA